VSGVAALPRPQPNETNAFFWAAAREHRLVLQRCDGCRQLQYPPDVVCVHCQARELALVQCGGTATLYSYAVVERVFHKGFTSRVPYVVGLVEIDEQPGLLMLTNIVGSGDHELAVGAPLRLAFEDRDGVTLPQFRLVDGADA
jgi:uncharacterized OB-fold protein